MGWVGGWMDEAKPIFSRFFQFDKTPYLVIQSVGFFFIAWFIRSRMMYTSIVSMTNLLK